MTQRNPMNDRYQADDHQGKTRKSAAAMKPKTKAASSVRMQPKEKTKQQKKAEKKVARQKQADLDRKYYNPPTERYKKLRRIWWVLLVGAIVATALSWLGRSWLPDFGVYATLIVAYGCIIGALYLDFSKIKKERRAYQAAMESGKSKEARAAEKQQKAEQREMKKESDSNAAAQEEPKAKRGILGGLFSSKDSKEKEASEKDSSKDGASEKNA